MIETRSAVEGLLRAAEGDLVEGTRLLGDAVTGEQKKRDAHDHKNDPPDEPWRASRMLGDVFLKHKDYELAIDSYGRLHYVWSNAEAGLRWRKDADALGLVAKPIADTPAPERPYTLDVNAAQGPLEWEPYAAPKLDAVDTEGKHVRLEDYRGQNVILVFYLNDGCVHCLEQLVSMSGKAADWATERTVVLAVSSVSPEKNKGSEKLGKLGFRLLSDPDHANARRFASYDDFEELELHSTILIDAKPGKAG